MSYRCTRCIAQVAQQLSTGIAAAGPEEQGAAQPFFGGLWVGNGALGRAVRASDSSREDLSQLIRELRDLGKELGDGGT